MTERLQGRVALVTGASSGFGEAIALKLAAGGAKVAIAARREERLNALAERIRGDGGEAEVIVADFGREDEAQAAVRRTEERFGRLDVLLNMASVYAAVPFDAMDEHTWQSVVDIDLRAAFLCAHAAVKHMRRAGGGRIVNFSDWLADSGRPRYPGYLPYYVAKKGVIGLTEALALEVAADQILVNAIAPSTMDTAENRKAMPKADFSAWAKVEDVAATILFLASSENRVTRGGIVPVYGRS